MGGDPRQGENRSSRVKSYVEKRWREWVKLAPSFFVHFRVLRTSFGINYRLRVGRRAEEKARGRADSYAMYLIATDHGSPR